MMIVLAKLMTAIVITGNAGAFTNAHIDQIGIVQVLNELIQVNQ